jgi:hypothetical protein
MALAEPRHPDHQEAGQWVGAKFDSEAFDLEKVNRSLARLR